MFVNARLTLAPCTRSADFTIEVGINFIVKNFSIAMEIRVKMIIRKIAKKG